MSLDERGDIMRWPIYDPRPDPLPVPGESWNDSPRRVLCINASWASHVIGVLSRLERSDAWSGTEEDNQRAQDELSAIIAALSAPFDGDCPIVYPKDINDGPAYLDCPNNNTNAEIEYISTGGSLCTGVSEMPCLDLTNLIEIRNGSELWVRNSCCEWEKIGDFVSSTESFDDSTNPTNDPDDNTQTWSACGKVDAYIEALSRMMVAGMTYYTSPLSFNSKIKESVPDSQLTTSALYLLLFDFTTITKLVSNDDIYNADMVQAFKCMASKGVYDTAESTDEELLYVMSAVKNVIYNRVTPATSADLVWTLWEQCYQALGPGDSKMLMNLGAGDTDKDCSCPPEPAEPGVFGFSGEYTYNDSNGDVTSVVVDLAGRRATCTYLHDAGQFKTIPDLRLSLTPTPVNGVTKLVVRTYPATPGTLTPAKEWRSTVPVSSVDMSDLDLLWGTDDYSRNNYPGYVDHVWENIDPNITLIACPSGRPLEDSATPQTSTLVMEIIQINDTVFNPVGPN